MIGLKTDQKLYSEQKGVERSDLQIGMRQGLSNIYSLFGAKSETPLEEINRLELHVSQIVVIPERIGPPGIYVPSGSPRGRAG